MKLAWTNEEIVENWSLLPGEQKWIANKTGATRLGFTLMFKFFQLEGRFPRAPEEVPRTVVDFIAKQVGVAPEQWAAYRWAGRTFEFHRGQIRKALGYREVTADDADAVALWLRDQILPHEQRLERLLDTALERFRSLLIEPPSQDRLERLARSSANTFEEEFTNGLLRRLTPKTRTQLDELLRPMAGSDGSLPNEPERPPLQELRAGAGRAGLETLERELWKLSRIRALDLPPDLFDLLSPQIIERYRARVAVTGRDCYPLVGWFFSD